MTLGDEHEAERAALTDTFEAIGPGEPTRRGSWTALDLAALPANEVNDP